MTANTLSDFIRWRPKVGHDKTDETGFGGFVTMLLVYSLNYLAPHRHRYRHQNATLWSVLALGITLLADCSEKDTDRHLDTAGLNGCFIP